MKLCVDCEYYVPNRKSDPIYAKCAFTPSPVDGHPEHYCDLERSITFRCGTNGRHFVPRKQVEEVVKPERKTFWAKIFN